MPSFPNSQMATHTRMKTLACSLSVLESQAAGSFLQKGALRVDRAKASVLLLLIQVLPCRSARMQSMPITMVEITFIKSLPRPFFPKSKKFPLIKRKATLNMKCHSL